MNCADIQRRFSLYLYGELDFAAEELVETQLAFVREKTWHTAATSEHRDVSLDLLSQCRQDLRSVIRTEVPGGPAPWHFRWPEALRISPTRWSYQLAVASFLVSVGYTGGRFLDKLGVAPSSSIAVGNADLGPFTRVRDVQPAGQDRVRILLDQVSPRELIGSRNDQDVKRWLLVGLQDTADPGIRVDSLEMLNGQQGVDVRDALLGRIQHDPNSAVRLKAVQSIRRFVNDRAVRNGIRSALEHDEDPAVRSAAIDVLAPADGAGQISPELAQTLQVLAHSEHDDYVRGRCLELLHVIDRPGGVY